MSTMGKIVAEPQHHGPNSLSEDIFDFEFNFNLATHTPQRTLSTHHSNVVSFVTQIIRSADHNALCRTKNKAYLSLLKSFSEQKTELFFVRKAVSAVMNNNHQQRDDMAMTEKRALKHHNSFLSSPPPEIPQISVKNNFTPPGSKGCFSQENSPTISIKLPALGKPPGFDHIVLSNIPTPPLSIERFPCLSTNDYKMKALQNEDEPERAIVPNEEQSGTNGYTNEPKRFNTDCKILTPMYRPRKNIRSARNLYGLDYVKTYGKISLSDFQEAWMKLDPWTKTVNDSFS
ncbi:hypothetical protein SCHPADRAFT_896632 [Schizopora paradoxa]|uniref:Uncharacterized protein n=1 Tax=Schizopora paradoxa TaxID=27342 RepID=A0A0H2QZZ7_9AGAM|nr:hypothetical protein SCHPADRAFT_896632 [Schizopora paradoxa]